MVSLPGGCGHAEVDGGGGAGPAVDLGELFVGAGQADFQAFGFAGPAFASGFGDAGGQVAADLGDAGPLGGVWPVHGASQAPLTDLTSMSRQVAACFRRRVASLSA